ncbi:MAG: hypothetical protein JXR76_29225 [Deltaproteobacteria bacterium]|nr:hypothetical protein [Deltaproteobacteria bacterium]
MGINSHMNEKSAIALHNMEATTEMAFEISENKGTARLARVGELVLEPAAVYRRWCVDSQGQVLLRSSELRMRAGKFEQAQKEQQLTMATCPRCTNVAGMGRQIDRLLIERPPAMVFDQASRQVSESLREQTRRETMAPAETYDLEVPGKFLSGGCDEESELW